MPTLLICQKGPNLSGTQEIDTKQSVSSLLPILALWILFCLPDSDVGAAYVTAAGELDALLAHRHEHSVANGRQIPTRTVKSTQ